MNWLRRHWPVIAAGALAAVLGAVIGIVRLTPDSAVDSGPLWAVKLPDLQGQETEVSRFRGRPLLVNFWATWCGPCKEEMPDLQRLAAGDLGNKIRVIGIGIDDKDKMRSFAADIGVTYTILQTGAPGLDLMKALGNRSGALPFTLVLDSAGVVVRSHIGKLSYEELRVAAQSAVSR
ncbi:MAG: TlpA family protein disulfide reductase [Burkholderiales bacterium]|nr:TlpA family protein disulfide reductase [Burkholderiales bacterium]